MGAGDYSVFTRLNGSTPLRNGLDPGQVLLIAALSATFVAVGTVLFARRDIAT